MKAERVFQGYVDSGCDCDGVQWVMVYENPDREYDHVQVLGWVQSRIDEACQLDPRDMDVTAKPYRLKITVEVEPLEA